LSYVKTTKEMAMKLYRFDTTAARPITQFGSVNAMIAPIQRTPGKVQIGCMHLAPGGVVGSHPAASPQLFLVVSGAGWVRGAEDERRPIAAGQAAFWHEGEGHASGTESGMSAIVIEGEGLDPAQYMSEVSA
jgi:quercetin dioxygenase-like cupin family protein